MNNRIDPNLGEVVYISIIFHIPASWLIYQMVTIFIFDGVTLQTSHNIRCAYNFVFINSMKRK